MSNKVYIIILNITRTGGTERAAINLANILIKKYDVTILSLNSQKDDRPYFIVSDKVRLINLSLSEIPLNLYQKLKWQIKTCKKLSNIIIQNSIVIGTGHNINIMLPFIKGSKTIACEHIQLDSIPKSHRKIMKLLYKYNDSLVVLSQTAHDKFIGYNNNIKIIPNALPFETKEPSKLINKRIIMVGRLSNEKGYDRIVQIAKNLKTNHSDWTIDIFGSGPIEQDLNKLYKTEGIEKWVRINKPVKNIQSEYLNSSIYMMTSYNEALPMVLLEAKACGIPLIAYECEGTKSLITNNFDGFLIQNNNIEDFNTKLNILILNYELRKQLGENALKSCVPFSKEQISNKWFELIESLF